MSVEARVGACTDSNVTPASEGVPGSAGAPRRLKPFPASSATSATNATAVTAQGSMGAPRLPGIGVAEPAAPAAAPVGTPHLWQNRAPGAIAAPQEAQRDCASDAPQLVQKSQPSAGEPAAGAPHCGQVIGASVLGGIP